MRHIVVVGAGQAGASFVAKLRAIGFEGAVTLVGEEDVPPYQRPPLSKAYLLGDMARERLFLRPESFYSAQNITLRTGTRIDSIDPGAKTLALGNATLSYDALVLTTGSVPRRLPETVGGGLDGVYAVRGLSDVDAMAPEFKHGRHVLIIGGGYIGLEAAAVAAKSGLKVTLVEMADRILQRVAAPETSEYFRALHQSHGVDIREACGLRELTGENGRVTGAVLSDGSTLDLDFVIAGVGITPASSLAEVAGLEIENGIKTNALGQCSMPDIWAAGDCASFPWHGKQMRLESVPNAIDQAELVAQNILGAEIPYVPKVWFWSDQYDVKLQIAGLNAGFDHVVVRDGGNTRSHWYFRGAQLLAVDAMNDPRAYMIGKRLIESGKTADPSVISDPSSDLKSMLKS